MCHHTVIAYVLTQSTPTVFGVFALQELEDMLLRYERQLKAETKARQAAEGAAAEALAAMGQPAQQGKQQPHQLTADLQHQQDMLQQVSLTFTGRVLSSGAGRESR